MVAAALGLQLQSQERRRQTVVELAGRYDREGGEGRELGLGLRFQQALGRRFVLRVDAHGVACRGEPPAYGARSELLLKF